jgi:DNA-binding NarL/FixJ family response regulator
MKVENMIRVILADDHALIRRGIRRILEKHSNICVVGEASTGTDALRLVQQLRPHVLLLDLEMPDLQGIQVARELRAKKVPVSIIILSACDDEHLIKEILQAGVDGYLSKSDAPSKILEMISRVSIKHTIDLVSLLLALALLTLPVDLYFF